LVLYAENYMGGKKSELFVHEKLWSYFLNAFQFHS
jgi:hypothetical protein